MMKRIPAWILPVGVALGMFLSVGIIAQGPNPVTLYQIGPSTVLGSTVPVSGTFWQATQPVSGTFWQATQPISAASLPLPTGAATNATLGSPFQAGGSIGNTSFGSTNWPTTVDTNTGSPGSSTPRVVSADGLLECAIVSAASTNATNCKGSAGNFFGYDLYNTTTTVYYLRLYNTSSSPTCSSSTGFIRSIPVPPAGASGQVGGAIRVLPVGMAYGTGISYCLTGGSSSTDNTNAAVGIFGTVVYR